MKKIYFLLTAFIFTLNAQTQNFGLVKDINTSKDANPLNPINNLYFGYKNNDFFITETPYNGSFAILNGVAYFFADDGIHGNELWRSDNTSAGTYMVKDITPGSGYSTMQNLTIAGNELFFTVSQRVYESDGTDEGTIPVPGITYTGDITTCLTPVGSTLYFFTNVSRLWKTNGTLAGTSLIIDFRQAYNYSNDWLGQLTNVNGTLFFTTGIGSDGAELWKSNGTAVSTMLVKDIYPGPESSRPSNLAAANGLLYFSADDGSGISLWVSDGTSNGTHPVINNGGVSLIQMKDQTTLDITPFPVINDVLYFRGFTAEKGTELYKYDLNNTSSGITLVKDISQGNLGSNPSNLTAVNNTLYFSISNALNQQQLWKSSGTPSGTTMVKNMGSGSSNYFSNFTAANGILLFSFYKPSNGYEPWKSDGTVAGTAMIKNIYAGNHSSYPGSFTYFNNNISLFSANDGLKGLELWHTTGESNGTQIVKNINNTTTASSTPNLDTNLRESIALNNQLYFSAFDPAYGNNLYISNGTAGGTHLLKDINNGNSSNPSNLTIFKNNIYFSADSAGYTSIYKTDGTDAGTAQLFNLGKFDIAVSSITASDSYLYVFFHETDSSYFQLWMLDGTSDSWQKIQNVYQSAIGISSSLSNNLYWNGTDSVHGAELWKATPETGSVQLVKDVYPGIASSNPTGFITYNNTLYFKATDSAYNSYIYLSDGTKKGTKRLYPGHEPIVEANGKLFFAGDLNGTTHNLFVSNGKMRGTHLLKDIDPFGLIAMDSIAYFSASDVSNKIGLWKSNGKTNGTVLVTNTIIMNSSNLSSAVADGKLYFTAYDSSYQIGLFVSDGTKTGTTEIGDVGLSGVGISNIKSGGDKLYISGYTYALGNELYGGVSPGVVPQINNAVANKLDKNKNFDALIVGNPVQDELRLIMNSYKVQQVQIIVTDASGKTLINKNESLYEGANNVSYSTKSWVAGVYILSIVAANGSFISLKAVKQ